MGGHNRALLTACLLGSSGHKKSSKENDLWVTISADWKVTEQCGIAAGKGNQLLGLTNINITYI